MSIVNDPQAPEHRNEDVTMKDFFEIIGLNNSAAVPWNPAAGTITLPLKIQTKDGQVTYIITTLPPAQGEIQGDNIEPVLQQSVSVNDAVPVTAIVQHPTQIIIHQSPIEDIQCQPADPIIEVSEGIINTSNPTNDQDQDLVHHHALDHGMEVVQNLSQVPVPVRLELWNPEVPDELTTMNPDHLTSSSPVVAPSTSLQFLNNFVLDDTSNQIFSITETNNVTNLSLSLPEPSFQHTYAAKPSRMQSSLSGGSNKYKTTRFKSSVNRSNTRKDMLVNQNISNRKVTKTAKASAKLHQSSSCTSTVNLKSEHFQDPVISEKTMGMTQSQQITSSPKKKRTIADWLAVGIDPTKLEENVDQVRNRFEKGCECIGEDENCFTGINPEFVYKHRLNIAELTRAEHDMYLMGVTMATLANPEATERNSKRQRLRNAYVFLGREVCLDAWLYLENCTHYQLKRIRKHLITHGVSARVHGNQGKKPHNTFPFRSYQLAFEYLNNWFTNYVKKSHGGNGSKNHVSFSKEQQGNANPMGTTFNTGGRNRTPKQNPAPIQLAPEQTRKRLHQDYKKYFEKQARKAVSKSKASTNIDSKLTSEKSSEDENLMGEKDCSSDEFKVMGYTSFSQFLKVRFPHVKFAKVELNNAKAISQATAAAAEKISSDKLKSTNKTVTTSSTVDPISSPNDLDTFNGEVIGGSSGCNDVSENGATNCDIEKMKRNMDSSRRSTENKEEPEISNQDSHNVLTSANQAQFVFSVPISDVSSFGDTRTNEDESTSIMFMVS